MPIASAASEPSSAADGSDRIKGIIFNLLEQVVVDEHGDDAWDDTLERAGVGGAYTAVGSYSDAEFLQLLAALPTADDVPSEPQLRWFGAKAFPLLAQRYPAFFVGHDSTVPFLLTLNDIIHPEVRKLYPDADVPVFDFTKEGEHTLVVGYRSARRLCYLAEGFIDGAAAHFHQRVSIEQRQCMHEGATRCDLVCRFTDDDRR
jgi:hypothetical protein